MDDKLKNMELTDDELNMVAGGASQRNKTALTRMCPVCHTIHELMRYDGCKLMHDRKIYSGVSQYVCEKTFHKFYEMADNWGNVIHFDENMNIF